MDLTSRPLTSPFSGTHFVYACSTTHSSLHASRGAHLHSHASIQQPLSMTAGGNQYMPAAGNNKLVELGRTHEHYTQGQLTAGSQRAHSPDIF